MNTKKKEDLAVSILEDEFREAGGPGLISHFLDLL